MKTLDPFICGKENEMSIQYLGPMRQGSPTVLDQVGGLPNKMLSCLPTGLFMLNSFVSNGARYYVDVGEHVEWATPECDSFEEVVTYELAGEKIALHGLDRLVDDGVIHGYRLHKRVRDSAGNVWGDHENYQIPRELNPGDEKGTLQPALAAFLAARTILLGAGMVNNDGKYLCAQKAFSISELASSETTRCRPIINTRDEPHDNHNKYRRLHLIGGDANVLPWASVMKLGMTAVLLRMVQEKMPLKDLTLDNPVYAARLMAADPSGKTRVDMANGKNMTAPQILSEFAARANQLSAWRPLPAQEAEVIKKWSWACDRLEYGRDDLFGLSDMVTKQRILQEYKETRPDTGLSRAEYIKKLQAIDLHYGIVGARYGKKGKKTQGSGAKLRAASDFDFKKVDRAVTEAPTTTRASLRGRAIIRSRKQTAFCDTSINSVGWDYISVSGSRAIKLTARQTVSSRLEKILSEDY